MKPAFGKGALRPALVERFYGAIRRGAVPAPVVNAAEVLVDRVHMKAFLDALKVDLVVDVGAHDGSYATNLRRLGYAGHIWSVEPNYEVFSPMRDRFASDARWSGLNSALGASAEVRAFGVPQMSNLGSFLDPVGAQPETTIDVRIETLDDTLPAVLERTGASRVLLKIDTQGFDMEVLKGAQRSLGQIVGLQCEISVKPIYKDMPPYLEALAHIESLGFELVNLCTAWRDPDTHRIVEYDCLAARVGEFD